MELKRFRWVLMPLVVVPVTAILIVPMTLAALAKLVVPIRQFRIGCRRVVVRIAEAWLKLLVWMFRHTLDTRFDVTGEVDVGRDRSYLLICNHQSWSDVPVLLYVFGDRVPFYRFFLKRELIRLPLLGLAFWALEYPFVRFSSDRSARSTRQLRGRNLSAAKRACEPLRHMNSTIVNFPEGAIYSPERHARRSGDYRHLLRPRAGGTALVLGALGDRLDSIIDVTLHFPDGPPGLGRFVGNRVRRVRARVRRVEIPPDLVGGDYENDPEFRDRFQKWLNDLWREKDERLDRMILPADVDD